MTVNRFWKLNARPVGNDFAAALSLEQEVLPALGSGEVLIRNEYLSMDAGTRMWMGARTDGYQPPLPIGSKMVGLCLGRIVASRAPGFAEGDLVRAFGHWADYSLVEAATSGLMKVDRDIPDPKEHFGALGMNAWTAYAGLTEVAKVQPGETVLVSAAAGATGSLACQIARNLGCTVVGIAGGANKCRYLTEEVGVALAIDYKNEDVSAALASVEGGIDAFFDNVGGAILDAALPNMAHYGRVAICGLISSYDREEAAPGPAHFDQILMRRLTISGFFIPDFLEKGSDYIPVLQGWMEAGRLAMRFDETEGLENVLTAYGRMLTGLSTGKAIVGLPR